MKKQIKRKRLTINQHVLLYERLKELLSPAKAAGLWVYPEGHSDLTVAKEFDLSEQYLMRTRIKLFGKLEHDTPYLSYRDMAKKIAELEKAVALLTRAHVGKDKVLMNPEVIGRTSYDYMHGNGVAR